MKDRVILANGMKTLWLSLHSGHSMPTHQMMAADPPQVEGELAWNDPLCLFPKWDNDK